MSSELPLNDARLHPSRRTRSWAVGSLTLVFVLVVLAATLFIVYLALHGIPVPKSPD